MKRKRKVGRPYSPWDRIALAERYATLKFKFLKAGNPKPGAAAEKALHEAHHRKRSLDSLHKLRVRGRCESILLAEAEVDLHRRSQRRS